MQVAMKREQEWLYLDKIDFKSKTVMKDKEDNCTMLKGSIHQNDITVINIYIPNVRALKYIKQILTELKGELVIQ